MKDIEQALQGGSEIPTPPSLHDKLNSTVDTELAASATSISVGLWLPLIVVGALAVTAGGVLWWGDGSETGDNDAVDSNAAVVGTESAQGERAENSAGRDDVENQKSPGSAAATSRSKESTADSLVSADDIGPAIYGTVLDVDGEPLAEVGIEVWFCDVLAVPSTKVTTDVNGSYEVQLRPFFRRALAHLESVAPEFTELETSIKSNKEMAKREKAKKLKLASRSNYMTDRILQALAIKKEELVERSFVEYLANLEKKKRLKLMFQEERRAKMAQTEERSQERKAKERELEQRKKREYMRAEGEKQSGGNFVFAVAATLDAPPGASGVGGPGVH